MTSLLHRAHRAFLSGDLTYAIRLLSEEDDDQASAAPTVPAPSLPPTVPAPPSSETRLVAAAPAINAEEAVRSCRRLVHKIALRYVRPNVEIEDLAQEGFIALMVAARKYRPDEGTPFSTYAGRYIAGACSRAMHVAMRRGLTPSHDYQQGERARDVASMDAGMSAGVEVGDGDAGGCTLHEAIGTSPSPEDAIDLVRGFSREMIRELATPVAVRHAPPPVLLGAFSYRGETMTLGEWASKLGVPYANLYGRIVRRGWSMERAIEAPSAKRRSNPRKKVA